MSIPDQEIENAILSWISILPDISAVPKDISSLSDAIILTEMMSQISPETFDVNNLSKEAPNDWTLKLANLTYFYKELEDFYSHAIGKAFDSSYVDIVKVSKDEEKDQLHNLVELVLGAAVQCENKEFYINGILTLDESCQNALMYLIEKALTRGHQETSDLKDASQTPTDLFQKSAPLSASKPDIPVKSLLAKIEELENENHQLGQRVSDLAQERDNMKIKMNELVQEVHKKSDDVRSLVLAKEGVLEKLEVQQSFEETKNEVKLKDFKIQELTKLIDEIKQKHQIELSGFQDEIDEQRRKIIQLSKLEATMEFYRQKYDDYSRVYTQLGDMEKQSTTQRSKIEELSAYNENLTSKVNKYKEKIEAEKTKNITLDIELTRRTTEIENLKNEKKRLESSISELEQNMLELNKEIERFEREQENNVRMVRSSIGGERPFLNTTSGQDFHEIIMSLERENEYLRLKQQEGISSLVLDDGESEILKKENEILKNKCKQIEAENENLRKVVEKSEDIKYVDKITTDNQNLKQEVEKVKKNAVTARIKAELEIKALIEANEKPRSIERIPRSIERIEEKIPVKVKEEKEEEVVVPEQKEDNQPKVQAKVDEAEVMERVEKLVKAEKEAYNKEVEKNTELKMSNERLQSQIEEITQRARETLEAEKKVQEERAKENIGVLKDEITTKESAIVNLNQKISELQASVEAAQKLEERVEKKESLIKELIEEIDTMKHVVESVGEQKEDELRVLTSALHEIAIRNTRLEKEVQALKRASDFSTTASLNKSEFHKKSQRI